MTEWPMICLYGLDLNTVLMPIWNQKKNIPRLQNNFINVKNSTVDKSCKNYWTNILRKAGWLVCWRPFAVSTLFTVSRWWKLIWSYHHNFLEVCSKLFIRYLFTSGPRSNEFVQLHNISLYAHNITYKRRWENVLVQYIYNTLNLCKHNMYSPSTIFGLF